MGYTSIGDVIITEVYHVLYPITIEYLEYDHHPIKKNMMSIDELSTKVNPKEG